MAPTPNPGRLDYLTSYARKNEPSDDELVIPDDLTELEADALTALADQADQAFDELFGDGKNISNDALDQLETLAAGVEKIRAEQNRRAEEQSERTEAATKLADRIRPADEKAEADEDCEDCEKDEDGDDSPGKIVAEVDADTGEVTDRELESVAASGKKDGIRVNLAGVKRVRQNLPTRRTEMSDVVLAAPDLQGFSNGQGMTWDDLGRGVDRRLAGYPKAQYEAAAKAKRALRQQFGVASLKRAFEPELILESDDPGHVDTVLQHAMNEHRLPGGSLVAAGSSGWCAPSETIYDLCEVESRDGLVSLPEIAIRRGGIRWTTGPDYSSIYNDTGFCYTEQNVIDGDYDGEGGGSKPCYYVDCPEFQDARLDLCGVCIQAGLLQSRGYPEMIARTIRGALVAHAHRMSANVIGQLVSQSTAVSLPADQVGTAAPILTAIELQVEHMKYAQRMSRGTTMEAIFPYWVRGAIRSDLSRRLGVELLDVPDSRIDAWFRSRGISVQFVYDWQGLESLTAANATAWPTSVQFLLYPAGTFVKGTSDIITLDTLYDSTLLSTNDYTALFTEEGYLVAKLCNDSRVITVPICPDGGTGAGVAIDCDGTAAPLAETPAE